MIVKYNNISIACDKAYYCKENNLYNVRLLDTSGNAVATFVGATSLSVFTVSGGTLQQVSSSNDCKFYIVRADGSTVEGPAVSDVLRGGVPFEHSMLLTSMHYGNELPTEAEEGQLFFKLVE